MSNFPKFLAMGLATFTLAACDVEQTQEGQMPSDNRKRADARV